MSLQTLHHVPLKSAYLCPDCNAIGNSSTQCPACAGEVLLSLAVVLDREQRPPLALESPYMMQKPWLAA